MSFRKQHGKRLTATLLLLAVFFPVLCFSLAAGPQIAAAGSCHHSAPQPVTPASHQKCCAPSPATKALLSARYTPPAPAIVAQAPTTTLIAGSMLYTPATETAILAAPPGFRVLRI